MVRLWMALLVGCGGKDGAGDPTDSTGDDSGGEVEVLDPASVPLNGECELAEDFGGFLVLTAADGSGVQGVVADGVVPVSVLEELTAEGDCRLLRRNNPYCDPTCEAGFTCDFDGNCMPYPVNQDLGIVTVLGLVQPVVMEPVFPGNTYYDTSLPNPPFTAGEAIKLDMPDGVYGPVALYGIGVETMVGLDEEWVVTENTPLEVSWEPPTGELVRSIVALTLSVDQHGTTPGVIKCDFADTGSGTIPASVIQGLRDSGVTGFPSAALERRTVDKAAAGDGCMDLMVSSPVLVDVDVEGFYSCFSTADCPEGLECNLELQICE